MQRLQKHNGKSLVGSEQRELLSDQSTEITVFMPYPMGILVVPLMTKNGLNGLEKPSAIRERRFAGYSRVGIAM